jgi:hypothetical protein
MTPSTDPTVRVELEAKKLALEIRQLERPFYRNPGFWFNSTAALAAIGGIFFQHQLSEVKSQRAELLVEKKERELSEKQHELEAQKSELDRLTAARDVLLEDNKALEADANAKRSAVLIAQQQLDEIRPQLTSRDQVKLESAQKQLDSAASSGANPAIELAVQQLFGNSRGIRNTGHATLTRQFFNDPRVIQQLWSYFQKNNTRQADGVINALLVLAQAFDTRVLRAEQERVRYLLNEASKIGAQAAKEAKAISRRLGD